MSSFLLALLVCVLASTSLLSVSAKFNYTKCPAPWELQSDTVKQNFSLKKFEGLYYELALHDYTQFPVCPSPRCVQSYKVVDYHLNQINDTFNLVCFGVNTTVPFKFGLTNTTGFFLGIVLSLPYITFPDTVVEVQEHPSGGYYDWVIEFQCLEKDNHVLFTGINWYSRSRNVTQDYLDKLLDAARARGLGVYMDTGLKVHIVDQKNCTKSG